MATNNSADQNSTGIQSLTSSGTFVGRSIAQTANQINVSNGNGISGNPTLSLTSNINVSGISFNSGTNILAFYATGTFTPTMTGAGTAGVTIYNSQVGYYTRIGNMVWVFGHIDVSSATGSGAVKINGLPFTIKNQSGG
jgi:hypothetical protein